MDTRETFERDLALCIDAQMRVVAEWHRDDPGDDFGGYSDDPGEVMMRLVLRQHYTNFYLWHVEDIARRVDVDANIIADCKRRIDVMNQRRNDAMEEVDAYLVTRLVRLLPQPSPGERVRHNTESLGMAIDRLSILALKIFHMGEQVDRSDAAEDHRASCATKLMALEEQRTDLATAVFDLIDDFCAGVKRPRAYYQFKMYNDPSLNPELYARRDHALRKTRPLTGVSREKGHVQ